MKKLPLIVTVLLLSVSCLLPVCEKKTAVTMRIFGSTTIAPFMDKAVKHFDKKGTRQFIVNPVGSNAGIDSFIAGTCDIAMSSMEMTPEHVAEAKKRGVSPKPFLLGYDVIVPIVHPSNKVTGLTFAQLRDIYEGTTYRWSALGGADTVIDVVDRAPSSGTYDIWHHYLIPPAIAMNSVTVCQSSSSVVGFVSEHANAIGYVSTAYLNPDVRPLKLDGIAISEDDSLLSQYHLKRPLYLYVDEKRFGAEQKALISFLIINEEGRNLLAESGFYSDFTLSPLHNVVEKMSKR